jgi:hypothetical protein
MNEKYNFPLKPIKVILNTYDKQIVFARLIYLQYEELFTNMKSNLKLDPNLQFFEYYIPYQSEDSNHFKWLINQPYIKMIKTGRSINDTITKLLFDIPDTELVYWAIDDRIPFWFDESAFYQIWLKVNEFNSNHTQNNVGRISLGSWAGGKDDLKEEQHKDCSCPKKERKFGKIAYHGYSQSTIPMRFWQHHYTQARVLKYIFTESGLPKESGPGMYSYLLKNISRMKHPILENYKDILNSNFFPVVGDSLIQFYESTKGRENKKKRTYIKNNIPIVLKNAKKLLEKHNLEIPTFGLEDTFTGGLRGNTYLIPLSESSITSE